MKIQTLKKWLFTQNPSKLIVLVLLINTACSNKHHNSNDSDEVVKAQIELLSESMENERKNIIVQLGEYYHLNEEFKAIESLNEKASYLFANKNNENISESFESYIALCDSLYQRYSDYSLQRKSILKISKWNDFVELDVLINQQIVQSAIVSDIQKSFFRFHTIKPIILPRNSEINLGEEYSAEFYIAGIDTSFNYTVSINGEQLPYKSKDNTCTESYLPIYKVTPTKKGLHKVEANMRLYDYQVQKYYNLPVEFEFEVK